MSSSARGSASARVRPDWRSRDTPRGGHQGVRQPGRRLAAQEGFGCRVGRYGALAPAPGALAPATAAAMRAAKLALAAALRTDTAVAALVPAGQVFAVERATVPTLPSIEVIGVSSERVDTGPLVRHELSIEVTVTHPTEDGADELLDGIVTAVRRRLLEALLHESSLARTMPTDRILICRCDTTLVGRTRSSD